MIPRYTRPEMGALWTETARFERMLDVEIASVVAWERAGKVPAGTAERIRGRATVDPVRIGEIEKRTNHDTAAFVSQVQETVEHDDARWIHFGLTSYDVVDPAMALLLRDACDILLAQLDALVASSKARALEHRDTVCMGRTHGIHAELTTFGAKLAGYAFEFARHRERLTRAREAIAVGKMAGPVGSYASVPSFVEAHALGSLGLRPEDAPTQIVGRDRHAEYLSTLAGIGASVERLAVEIRHLARTEVREAEEPFDEGGQKGSSAMPHKRNPWRCERLSGLARLLRGYAHAGWENVPSWHERDMSQSSAERVALADASIVCDFMLAEIGQIVAGMRVYPQRMRRNIEASGGLVFSQHVLLGLIESGLSRDEAYPIVQQAAMTVWESDRSFAEVLKEDPRVAGRIDLTAVLDEQIFLRNIGIVFDRLERL